MGIPSFALEALDNIQNSIDYEESVADHFEDLDDSIEILDSVTEDSNAVNNSVLALNSIMQTANSIEEPTVAVMESLFSAVEYHGNVITSILGQEALNPQYATEGVINSAIDVIDGFLNPIKIFSGVKGNIQRVYKLYAVISKAFHDAITSVYELADRYFKTIKTLRDQVHKKTDRPFENNITISYARTISFNGEISPKAIIEGGKQTAKILDIVTGDYRKHIFNHFENVFVQYQKAIKAVSIIDYAIDTTENTVAVKALEEFKNAVDNTFKASLKTVPDNLEISGGYTFGFQNKSVASRPRLYNRPDLKVKGKQTVKTPTKTEMLDMITIAENISKLVYDRKTWLLGDLGKIWGDANMAGAIQGQKEGNSSLKSVIANIDAMLVSHTDLIWYTYPIANTSRIAFAFARDLLFFVEDALEAYPDR